MSSPPDSPLAASLRALLDKQGDPAARDTPALVLSSLRKMLGDHDKAAAVNVAAPVAALIVASSPRAALVAKLEASTDNATRFAIAEAINNLPVEGAF
jgi:hypothetical protein